ncbi:MAG: hypothetical protein P8Y60_09360 [Calditrichota bacterium]
MRKWKGIACLRRGSLPDLRQQESGRQATFLTYVRNSQKQVNKNH